MNSKKIFNCLSFKISFLLFLSGVVKSIDKELPSFVEIPPPIQYYAPGDSSIELRCDIWPSSAKVQFMVSSKKIWQTALNPSKNVMELNVLDKNVGVLISQGKLRISNQNHLKNIQDQSIHCLASTDFATILSHPFRITRAGMSEFGGDLGNQSKTVEKLFLLGNVAIIDCWPPESHPRAVVKFNFNYVEIKNGGKYRIIEWPNGKRVSLLIEPVEHTDTGSYRCVASNPVTGQSKVSSEIVNIRVEVPTVAIPPSITVPISGRLNGPQQIIARRGDNVTLFCVMRGSPVPKIQIYNYNNDLTSSSRYFLDRKFGLLSILDVKVSDGGSYMCRDKYITSSAVLKVVEPLNITTRPTNVVLDAPVGSARFDCVLSKPSIIVQWFFNGQPITGSSNGSVYVPAVSVTNLGLYQCVAQDHNEWVSASATLSIKSYTIIIRPTSPLDTQVQPPVLQNVDTQEQFLSVPNVNRIHDNMAVYVSWHLLASKLGHMSYFVLQYISKHRNQLVWSPPLTVQNKFNHTYYYLTDRYISPQTSYRFRVHTFFTNGHTITSTWSKDIDFYNVGDTAPIIEESSVKSPGTILIRWSYHSVAVWPVDTFRVLIRQQLTNITQSSTKKFDKYSMRDVPFPTMSITVENLNVDSIYQVIVYGVNGRDKGRTITKFSPLHTVVLPPLPRRPLSATTPASKNGFIIGLLESWKNNRLLYGSLFALTGFLIVVMFLLLLLCLCRQRRFRNSKEAGSTHTFPYAYKEVRKTSMSANNNNNNNSSTLQMPGRMPQYSSEVALQQLQSNNDSIDRRTMDTGSQIHRDNSSQAMETASLVTDLYSQNYVHGGHVQYPYQGGFSTLPQGYPSNRSNAQYQHFLIQQQQQGHGDNSRRDKQIGDFNRDSMIDQSVEMPSRHMSASQQQLMMIQSQEHPQGRAPNIGGYYSARAGAMSPQMMAMMMGSQQSLGGPYGPYRSSSSNRSNSQNYQGVIETPIAISATGHPMYQMDHMVIDPSGRPLSPQYHYMQQQQGPLHPAMVDLYNQSHGYTRPGASDYSQHSLYRQQSLHNDGELGGGGPGVEPGYSYLPTNHHGLDMMVASRQHTLNSLPEQPLDMGHHPNHHNNSNNNNNCLPQQHNSHGGTVNAVSNSNNNNSSGRHHHRRKTRSRQQNIQQDNPSLERVQDHQGEMPPMLAPRSKMPYGDQDNMPRLSIHDQSIMEGEDLALNDCHSESNTNGDHYDPPLQYSAHYDPNDPNDNDITCPSNSMLIENLPRIRDVSEYGIPINNNNNNHNSMSHQRSVKHQQPPYQVPVPPLKSAGRYNALSTNGYNNMECNPDYYSSATSSDRSGPSPPPKYVPVTNLPMSRQDEAYMKNLYYHGDTHC